MFSVIILLGQEYEELCCTILKKMMMTIVKILLIYQRWLTLWHVNLLHLGDTSFCGYLTYVKLVELKYMQLMV